MRSGKRSIFEKGHYHIQSIEQEDQSAFTGGLRHLLLRGWLPSSQHRVQVTFEAWSSIQHFLNELLRAGTRGGIGVILSCDAAPIGRPDCGIQVKPRTGRVQHQGKVVLGQKTRCRPLPLQRGRSPQRGRTRAVALQTIPVPMLLSEQERGIGVPLATCLLEPARSFGGIAGNALAGQVGVGSGGV